MRISTRLVEKEVNAVVAGVADVVDKDMSKEEVVQHLTSLVSRLQGLKRKVWGHWLNWSHQVLKLSGLSFSILSTTLTFVIIYKGTDSWSTVMQLLLPWLYVSDDKLVLVDRVFEAIASHIPDMCCLVASLLRLPTFGSTPHSFLCNENKPRTDSWDLSQLCCCRNSPSLVFSWDLWLGWQLDESNKSEQAQVQRCRARLDHLSMLQQLGSKDDHASWNNVRVERILVDYMLRSSYYDTATKLAEANNLQVTLFFCSCSMRFNFASYVC